MRLNITIRKPRKWDWGTMSKAWGDSEINILRRMRADGARNSEIASLLGRSLKAVEAKAAYLNMSPEMKRARQQAEHLRKKMSYRARRVKSGKDRKASKIWPPEKIEQLFVLRDKEKKEWSEIAAIMGFTTAKVYSRYHYELHSSIVPRESAQSLVVPDGVREDRLRRQLLSPRDLTAAFCGDPLPGFSALERLA